MEREGLAPEAYRGSTEIEQLRHTFRELMYSSDGCSTSLLCYGYQHVQKLLGSSSVAYIAS